MLKCAVSILFPFFFLLKKRLWKRIGSIEKWNVSLIQLVSLHLEITSIIATMFYFSDILIQFPLMCKNCEWALCLWYVNVYGNFIEHFHYCCPINLVPQPFGTVSFVQFVNELYINVYFLHVTRVYFYDSFMKAAQFWSVMITIRKCWIWIWPVISFSFMNLLLTMLPDYCICLSYLIYDHREISTPFL